MRGKKISLMVAERKEEGVQCRDQDESLKVQRQPSDLFGVHSVWGERAGEEREEGEDEIWRKGGKEEG